MSGWKKGVDAHPFICSRSSSIRTCTTGGGILAILHAAMYGLEIVCTSTLKFLFGVVRIRW